MDAATATTALSYRVSRLRRAVGVLDPVVWAHRRGWAPDEVQRRILRSQSRRLILLCTRQFGKSTTAACIAAHRAVTRPGSMILLVSRSERQSGELFAKVKKFVGDRRRTKDKAFEWQLTNGSRIVAVPSSEETIRSFSSVDLLLEDEAALVPDIVYKTIRPMLAVSRGRLILMSTAHGQRGHFFKAWSEMKAWERFKVTADQCPRISAEFLAEEREELGLAWYSQEYGCEFLSTEEALFTEEEIMRAFTEGVAPVIEHRPPASVTPLFGG